MSDLFVDNIKHQSSQGSGTITIGASGETINVVGTLQNNGSAVGGTNTPSFSAKLTSNFTLTQNVLVLLPFATEQWDTAGAYDNTATNYKFTVPSDQAGKYQINVVVSIGNQPSGTWLYPAIYKNGSNPSAPLFYTFGFTSVTQDSFAQISGVFDLSVSDYIQVYCTTSEPTNKTLAASRCIFQAYKLIE